MLAFQITINGDAIGTFGFDDWVFLSSIITANRARRSGDTDELLFDIAGTAETVEPRKRESVRLLHKELKIGDEVLFSLVNSDEVSPPLKRYRSDATVQEDPFTEAEILEFEKTEFERLKKKFMRGE